MTADTLSWLARFEAGQYKPVTFLERGVALPFTTPTLLGARIRPGERKSAELVLANPAGVEGVYVLGWSSLPDVCSPSLHDRALWGRVAQLSMLTPGSVRKATRAVAAEGLAGRAAAKAAAEAAKATRDACTLTHYHLLLELVRQGDPTTAAAQAADFSTLEQRARAVLVKRKADGGLTPAAAFEVLAELAEVFEPCGLPRDPTRARLPKLAAEIGAVMQDLARWAEHADQAERSCVRLLAESAVLTQRCFKVALAEAQTQMEDLWSLLQRWRMAPEPILNLIARPEWLLDGWEMICGLWRGAAPAGKNAALLDMAGLVPVIPIEVGDWAGFDAPGDMDGHRSGLRRWRRTVNSNEDWATGRLMDLTARNETLRARCT